MIRSWFVLVGGGIALAAARLLLPGLPWEPITLVFGSLCAAAILWGARSNGLRPRWTWVLFAVSIMVGAASSAMYRRGLDTPPSQLADYLDIVSYVAGGIGFVGLLRRYAGRDPDSWLDASVIGIVVGMLLWEFVLRTPGSAGPGGTDAYALAVALLDTVLLTSIAHFILRPISHPVPTGLLVVLALILASDASSHFADGLLPASLYEAQWLLGYAVWAAIALHPSVGTVTPAASRVPLPLADEIRQSVRGVALQGLALGVGPLLIYRHVAGGAPLGTPVLVAGSLALAAIVTVRLVRLMLRLGRDAERRRLAEDALRRSEERFRRLADVAPVGVFISDNAGRSLFQNAAWARAAGRPAAGGLGAGFAEAIHPADRERVMAEWDESVQRRAPYRNSHRYLLADGSVRWVTADAVPVNDAEGRSDGWVGTVADVTELAEARMAAEGRERFVRALIEQSPVGISIHAQDGTLVEMNDAEREILEIVAEVTGLPETGELLRQIACQEPAGVQAIERAFDGEVVGFEPIAVRPAGSESPVLWFRQTYFPVKDQAGALVAVISMTEDITAGMRSLDERRAVDERLQETAKLEALGVLAGGIAHDFNNLLVAILGHASLARAEMPSGSAAEVDIVAVERAAQRAADLAHQMLAYSGRGNFSVVPLQFDELLREMGDLVGRSIAKNAALVYSFAPNVPPVLADITQLRQVALNLIINASDALGGETGVISLRTGLVELAADDPEVVPGTGAEPGTYAMLEVSDTGSGMDRATLARIFDPFFTTKSTGRGLGLAATLGIVKGHGGALRVRSTPGIGTRFQILLRPAAMDVPSPGLGLAVSETAEMLKVAVRSRRSAGRILVVDDEDSVRRLARRVLVQAGYEVTEASDGPEAVEVFSAQPDRWTGVLLDVTLPNLDGVSVLERIRRVRPDIPIVMSSGWAAEEVAARLGGTSGVEFLPKPYRADALVHAFD